MTGQWELDTLALIDFTYPFGFTFKGQTAIRRGSGWELLDSPERLPIPDHQVHHVAVQKLVPAGAVVLPELDPWTHEPWDVSDVREYAGAWTHQGSRYAAAIADAVDAAAQS